MKKIELEGIGSVSYQPVRTKDAEGVAVDSSGNKLKYVVQGERTAKYVRVSDGVEVSRTDVCKEINGKVLPKFKATIKVSKKHINTIDGDKFNSLDMWGQERSCYIVEPNSDAKKLMDAGKVITFPMTFASGHKAWRAVMRKVDLGKGETAYIIMAVRHDLREIIKQFKTEAFEGEFELPVNDDDVADAVNSMGI